MKTYKGSCHCGTIRFTARFDLSQGTGKCNCTYCAKIRMWGAMVKPEDFELVAGEKELKDYQYGAKSNHLPFCMHCGVHAFAKCDIPVLGGEIYSVNLACLDDLDPRELGEAKVQFFNGRDELWFEPPAYTKHL